MYIDKGFWATKPSNFSFDCRTAQMEIHKTVWDGLVYSVDIALLVIKIPLGSFSHPTVKEREKSIEYKI